MQFARPTPRLLNEMPKTIAKIVAITALFLLSSTTALAQHHEPLAAFDRDQPLRFDHLCSELGHGYGAYRQAYAFFEKRSPDDRYQALVLAKVQVGWIAGPPGPNGVSLLIEKKRLALPPEWYGDTFGLALQLVSVKTQRTITGPVFTRYVHVTSDHGGEKEYRLSPTGELDWVRFVEPEERDAQADKEHRHPPELHLYAKDIPALEGAYALNLVLENTRTSARVTIEGPVMENLRSLLQIKKPKSGVLGFAQAMNPFQQGGVWDALGTAWRYRNCIQLRKQAKQELDRRFAHASAVSP